MSVTEQGEMPRKMGRPGLSEDQKAQIWRELSPITPRTPAYREARRKLAGGMDRTESLIDKVFRDQLRMFLEKNKGRVPQSEPTQTADRSRLQPIGLTVPQAEAA